MSKYIFEETSNLNIWKNFIVTSKEHTIFAEPIYLNNFADKVKFYLIKKGIQIKAGVFILSNNKKMEINDLIIYFGILFENNSSQKSTKSFLERFEISEFIIERLNEMYEKIDMVLSPEINDIRPFLWHNYHSKNIKEKFKVDIRYTSYIDISSLNDTENKEETHLFKNLETLRQRNIREARKNEAYTLVEDKIELFIHYYDVLLQSQQSKQSEEKLKIMTKLINSLIKNKFAKMYISYNNNNIIQYITVFAWDKYRAYYLFGAPNPKATERYKGTISFWDAFIDLANFGHKQVDMEGINSPQRGWFKSSFGGEIKTYYRVTKDKTSE